jgi:LuxR family maltose regulon positive regulatory protein
VRSLAYYALGSVYQAKEAYPQAIEAYQQAIQFGRTAENLVAEMMSTVGLAGMAFERGQLHLAFEIAAPVSARMERAEAPPPIGAVIGGLLGQVCYQWDQRQQARKHVQQALRLSTLGGYNSGVIFCRVLLSRLAQLQGDLEAAAGEIEAAAELMRVETPDYVRQEAVSQQVRLYLARHRFDAARMVLQGQGFSFDPFSFPELTPDQRVSHSTGLLYNSALRLLLYQARTSGDRAGLHSGLKLAEQLIAKAGLGQYLLVLLEAFLLRAQMYAALGADHRAASRADYLHALELGEPEGFIGVFIDQGPPVAEALADLTGQNQAGTVQPDYIGRILRSQGPTPGDQPAALVEPLTERELEVLRLMAEGLKYKEIAARLVISLNTVRFHVKALYGKLNVNNRTQAIKAARQHRLL